MLEAIQWKPGMVITQPGMYAGVPMEVYHGPNLCDGPSISSSGLRKIFQKSEAHYWKSSPYNPKRVIDPETEAKTLGRAAHHLLLGETEFKKSYVIRPEEIDGEAWNGNKKICKSWLAKQALAGLTVVTQKQTEQIIGMAEAIQAHPFAASSLRGQVERTLVYRDAKTGVWVKVRPDSIPNDSGDVVDLKTTGDVSKDAIENTIGDYGYHQQGALIGEAFRQVLGLEMQSFSLVFVESGKPHCVFVYTPLPSDLERAHDANELSLQVFARRMNEQFWPGPGGTQKDAAYIGVKPWTRKREEDRIDELKQELAA